MDALPPLPMSPILLEKVWGGRRLGRYAKSLPGDERVGIGESWEIADLDATSASGAGGGAARTSVRSGPFGGRTIREMMDAHERAVMGDLPRAASGGFPLLVKILDAQENLSVQVHPSPAYARAHPEAHLKTESWLVLEAEPGATLYTGLKQGVDEAALRDGIERGEVAPLLETVPAAPGTCYTLPSGLVHALGAGVLVAEVQTPSDTTFRLFDWGRAGRELHVEEAIACIEMERQRPPEGRRRARGGRGVVAETGAYRCAVVTLAPGETLPAGAAARPRVWMGVSGEGSLRPDAGDAAPIVVRAGETVLLAAACEAWTLAPDGAGLTLLETTFPTEG